MSDWIKTGRAIYRREKISGVRIYNTIGTRGEYRVEVLIEGNWCSYYISKEVYYRDEAALEAAHTAAWEVYRRLCAELE